MKFVLSYTLRDGGSLAERETASKRALQLLAAWKPTLAFTEWVQRADGDGGFVVFESDDAATILRDTAVWATFLRFELHPVLEVLDATPIQQEANDFRDSIS